MPIVYSSIIDEHMSVRNNIGLFDVSHMGEFIIRGKQALDLIQQISSNDASTLEIGDAQYSCIPNKTTGIVDDMLVYRLPEDLCSEGERAYMLVVNASNIEKDWDWISDHNIFNTRLINISEDTGLLALQGPKAKHALQKLTNVDLNSISYYTFKKGYVAGIENVIVSATGYTGSGGFELYVNKKDVVNLWHALMEAGKEFDIKPCGLGARDTLRLEMGFCLYGNDIDDTTSPLEAGLGWITKLNKACDFNLKNYMINQKSNGLQRKLVGFILEDRRVPRHHYPILDSTEGKVIGVVTSGTQSPNLDCPIGMGYVPIEYSKPGQEIFISFGKKELPAKVVKLPFVKV
jgi:aminomethyltransferase